MHELAGSTATGLHGDAQGTRDVEIVEERPHHLEFTRCLCGAISPTPSGGIQRLETSLGGRHRLVREIPVRGPWPVEDEQPDRRGSMVGQQVLDEDQIAGGLGHLLPRDAHGPHMHPRSREGRDSGGCLSLRCFVGVMGEGEIGSTGVDVDARPVGLHHHRRALGVPAGPSRTPGARPCGVALR